MPMPADYEDLNSLIRHPTANLGSLYQTSQTIK
jgi:hypothetical protein